MITLTIDQRPIEVAEGTKVIQAAERLGIHIPRLCYHPALGSVGACRLCAVKVLDGPVTGLQMSCMLACQPGMVVATDAAEAVEFRRHVVEWLMLHHPHDCPVCDEGGHCLLQEMTVAGGHGLRRTAEPKRTFRDQALGPLLQHEMNRCIHCYRCVRVYQEVCGGRDLGALGIGHRTWFGRYRPGAPESPFAGNLADVCPTGVFTDKPSRYRGRRWDFERSPSLCLSCSLGCHTTVSARYREVVRLEARHSAEVNGWWLCDRGRHAYVYANLPERPRQARVDGAAVSSAEALRAAAQRLAAISRRHGPRAVALAGSARASLETMAALARLAQERGWDGPELLPTAALARRTAAAVASLESNLGAGLQDLGHADWILVAAADPVNEAPLLALALRQAWRAGAHVTVLDPRPVELPLEYRHLPWAPAGIGSVLEAIVDRALGGPHRMGDEAAADFIAHAAATLAASRRPVLVCGPELGGQGLPQRVAGAVQRLRAAGKGARLLALLPGANAFGAALVAPAAGGWDELLAGIESGGVKALLLAEADPIWQFADRRRLEGALARLELLVALDYLPSASMQAAQILVPTACLFENGGRFINHEGRVQAAAAALDGGLPITQSGAGDHPPRRYDNGRPAPEVISAWQALDLLRDGTERTAGQVAAELEAWLRQGVPRLAELPAMAQMAVDAGWRVADAGPAADAGPPADAPETGRDALHLLCVERTFGSEELSACSPQLRELELNPCIWLAAPEAAARGLAAGGPVRLTTARGELVAPLAVSERMAPQVVIVPRVRQLAWQRLGSEALVRIEAA
jgi:NADH-quinone oxidoreductase subunit G